MATGKGRDARAERERSRLYQARQAYHAARVGRRRRDNILAAVIGGAIVLAAIGGQVAYFSVGPGAPAPAPTGTPSPAATDSESPAPSTPAPEPDPTATQ